MQNISFSSDLGVLVVRVRWPVDGCHALRLFGFRTLTSNIFVYLHKIRKYLILKRIKTNLRYLCLYEILCQYLPSCNQLNLLFRNVPLASIIMYTNRS